MNSLRSRMAAMVAQDDMVSNLVEDFGMSREVAERIARSAGTLGARLLRQGTKS